MELSKALQIVLEEKVRQSTGLADIEDALMTITKQVLAPIQKELEEVRDAAALHLVSIGAKDGEKREVFGNICKLKVKRSYRVVKDEAYELIDKLEPGLVKRDPSIHWQHLKKFINNCNDASRKRLFEEGFITETCTNEVEFI